MDGSEDGGPEPWQVQRYVGVAASLRSMADVLWVGLPAPLPQRCGCFVVGAWMEIFFGFLLPTWLLARAEGAESPCGGGRTARFAAAILHPAVLLAAAALGRGVGHAHKQRALN